MTTLPHSEACERNKAPILEVLQRYLTQPGTVLEIGAGTGQHAVYFAQHLPHLRWQPSDQHQYLAGIRAWLEAYPQDNLQPPLELDVAALPWPELGPVDAVFTANTLHIMGWREVELTFEQVGKLLDPGQYFMCYGPFNQNGEYTSDSNQRFDQMLRQRDPASGIRDLVDLKALADAAGMILIEQCPMPANNQVLVWQSV